MFYAQTTGSVPLSNCDFSSLFNALQVINCAAGEVRIFVERFAENVCASKHNLKPFYQLVAAICPDLRSLPCLRRPVSSQISKAETEEEVEVIEVVGEED
jgi:hypothetical protein